MRNCTLANQTYTSVEVKCVPGYDGGLPQKFVLEVYHGDVDFLTNSQPLYNVSNPDEPTFALTGLEASVEAGVHVAVYAANAKGRSQPVILSEVTYRDAEKRTGEYKFALCRIICFVCKRGRVFTLRTFTDVAISNRYVPLCIKYMRCLPYSIECCHIDGQ